jgi:RND family efflux transporter MFP subunit
VRFPVPENEVSRVKKEQMAEIKIPALGSSVYHGKVEEIGVIANILSRSYDAKIGLPNLSGDIRPGMVCNVRLMIDEKTNCLVVPNHAVQVDDNGDRFVFVADTTNNKAQKRKITVGPLLTEGICITGGLEINEKVIVSGNQKLADNSAIAITVASGGSGPF